MTVIVTDHHEVPFDEQDGEKTIQNSAGRCGYGS